MYLQADLNQVLFSHFELLDKAPISPNTSFKTPRDKERYETLLNYALRKYSACIYHFENVKRFVKEEELELKRLIDIHCKLNDLDKKPRKSKLHITRNTDKYIYEFSAFLVSLKSSLDILAEVCPYYLYGISVNYSIKPLIKGVEKNNKDGLIWDAISNNLSWIKTVRDYRHHLVHRLIFGTESRCEVHGFNGIFKAVRYPVVIPEHTPSFILDTRADKMMREAINDGMSSIGWDLSHTESRVVRDASDRAQELIDYVIEASPSVDYTSIEEFMELHIKNYQNLFIELVDDFGEIIQDETSKNVEEIKDFHDQFSFKNEPSDEIPW